MNGRPLIWFDNGATTQKPQSVIDRISYFYEHENSNVHRAAHELAARATDAYESAREKTRRFLNAGSTREIVFVRGATEAINLVAQSWGRRNIQKDDEIVITWLEHHANIVPWQMLCAETRREYHRYSHRRSCKENCMSRFQEGSILRLKRKSGSDIWVFRWYEELNGTRTYRKVTIGTVDRFPLVSTQRTLPRRFGETSTPSSECRRRSPNSSPTIAITN